MCARGDRRSHGVSALIDPSDIHFWICRDETVQPASEKDTTATFPDSGPGHRNKPATGLRRGLALCPGPLSGKVAVEGEPAGLTRSMSNLPLAHRMRLRAHLSLPHSWWFSRRRFPSQNRSPALWGSCERAGEASWCSVHAMSSHLRAHSASPIYGCPVCRTGRREQWSSCDVKDGQRHPELDLPVDERVIHPPGHTALRRRIAGGVLGSPQAVGGRLGVSRRPVPVRSDSHLPAGVASWSSARPRCANLRPAPTQRVPPTSQAHLALNSHVQPPPRVLVSESRLPARRQVLAARGR